MLDLAGKVFVITGATAGIGLATAEALAARGATIGLVGRDPGRLAQAAKAVCAASEVSDAATFVADLGLVSENLRLAEQIAEQLGTVDVLINNVGAVFPERRVTVEGIEATLALNHVGPFALTNALMPALRSAEMPRVVSVSSQVHATEIDWGNLQGGSHYGGIDAYRRSKLLNLFFIAELHRRHGDWLTTAAIHPGVVATGLLRSYDKATALEAAEARAESDARRGVARRVVGRIARNVLRTGAHRSVGVPVGEGCATSVFVATDPSVDGHPGGYWRESRLAEPAPIASDPAAAARAWSVTERLIADVTSP